MANFWDIDYNIQLWAKESARRKRDNSWFEAYDVNVFWDKDTWNYSEFEEDWTQVAFWDATCRDDLRITPWNFDRPWSSDPTIQAVTP